jgi:hypothetical protein
MIIDGLRRRSFVVRYLTLLGGETASKLCVMGTFAYLARVLGPHQFGMIELALSITVFFVLGGLGPSALRQDHRGVPERAPALVPRVGRCGLCSASWHISLRIRPATAWRPAFWRSRPDGAVTPFFTQWVFGVP